MLAYIARRLLLVIPTLIGIMVLNFLIVQAAPGGPVDQMLSQIKGNNVSAAERVSGSTSDSPQSGGGQSNGKELYRGARGLDAEFVAEIEQLYGFDKPAHERFFKMMLDYSRFDFGDSFFS